MAGVGPRRRPHVRRRKLSAPSPFFFLLISSSVLRSSWLLLDVPVPIAFVLSGGRPSRIDLRLWLLGEEEEAVGVFVAGTVNAGCIISSAVLFVAMLAGEVCRVSCSTWYDLY